MHTLKREKHTNSSGWLSELVSMNYDDDPFNCLHSYLVSINPDCNRANHYHRKKEEWIGIAYGKINLLLEDINTKEKKKFILDSDASAYELVHIPPNVAHTILNVSGNISSIIVFSKTPEDREDVYSYEVKEVD